MNKRTISTAPKEKLKQKYCVGFIFNHAFDKVLLIKKIAPDWQKDLLNGCGDKIEAGEDYISAMVRECKEETGLKTNKIDWFPAAKLTVKNHNKTAIIKVFYADLDNFEQLNGIIVEKEQLFCINIKDINKHKTVPNLKWLIPYCIYSASRFNQREEVYIKAKYKNK